MDESDIQLELDFVLEVLDELQYVVQASGAIAINFVVYSLEKILRGE